MSRKQSFRLSCLLALATILGVLVPCYISTYVASADSGVWTVIDSDPNVTQLYDVWGASSRDVFAVGTIDTGVNGVVLRCDGSTWSATPCPTTRLLYGVWGSSANDVFAVGLSTAAGGYGAIVHYADGTWHDENIPACYCLEGIWGSSAGDIFAVGVQGNGSILHYYGGAWHAMTFPAGYHMSDIWGSAGNNVFAAGYYQSPAVGAILRYDGNTWKPETIPAVNQSLDIWGSSASEVFASFQAGASSSVLHYSGSTWESMSVPTGYVVSGLWGDSATDVFGVGSYVDADRSASILRYGGNAWSPMSIPAGYGLNKVWGTLSGSSLDVFAVGDINGGHILHYCEQEQDPTRVLSPVVGLLEVIGPYGTCSDTEWCFNQHQTASDGIGHIPGGGVGHADDTYAWDANLNYPQRYLDTGKPVYAAASGTVAETYAGGPNADPSRGWVLVEHNYLGNTWWSGYLHMTNIQVVPGEAVAEYTVLGYISNVGVYDGNSHLHFVVYAGTNTFGGLTSFDTVITPRGACTCPTATGTGTATLIPFSGSIETLTAVSEGTLPATNKPKLTFGHGLFEFRITGLSNGESVTLTITLPYAVPTTTQYWKYGPTPGNDAAHWYQIPMGDNDGDNVITITLRDGGLGDDVCGAGTEDGVIIDQGGPGWPGPSGGRSAPAFPCIYIGIGAALVAGIAAYLVRRRMAGA